MAFSTLCFCRPVIGPWAIRENNALELANQSARYIGYKQKPYNKYMLFSVREVRIGKNCARGLELNTPDRGHSLSFPNTKTGNNVFILFFLTISL